MAVTDNRLAHLHLIQRPGEGKYLNVGRWIGQAQCTHDGSGGDATHQISLPTVGQAFSGQHILWTVDAIGFWPLVGAAALAYSRIRIWPYQITPVSGLYTMYEYDPVGAITYIRMDNFLNPVKDCMFELGGVGGCLQCIVANTNGSVTEFVAQGRFLNEEMLP